MNNIFLFPYTVKHTLTNWYSVEFFSCMSSRWDDEPDTENEALSRGLLQNSTEMLFRRAKRSSSVNQTLDWICAGGFEFRVHSGESVLHSDTTLSSEFLTWSTEAVPSVIRQGT